MLEQVDVADLGGVTMLFFFWVGAVGALSVTHCGNIMERWPSLAESGDSSYQFVFAAKAPVRFLTRECWIRLRLSDEFALQR